MVDIKEALRLHALWLAGDEGGVRASLYGADLRGADLYEASLYEASLYEANLYEANLCGANLWSVRGNGREVKSLQIGCYDVAYTAEVLQIGCRRKPITEWLGLDSVPGYYGLGVEWTAFKPLIKQIIEQYPAIATDKENQNG